jgi:hypothetical protein
MLSPPRRYFFEGHSILFCIARPQRKEQDKGGLFDLLLQHLSRARQSSRGREHQGAFFFLFLLCRSFRITCGKGNGGGKGMYHSGCESGGMTGSVYMARCWLCLRRLG